MGPLIDALFFAAGLVLLVKSADWLVLGGALIAEGLGVRPLVVGLTIVAFGTSAPELAAGIGAALRDHGEIVIGTVVGSNIANVALILGVASLIRPVPCRRPVVVREMPIMLAAITLGAAAMLGGTVNRWEGAALTAGILVYIALAYRVARRAPELFEPDTPKLQPPPTADSRGHGGSKTPRSSSSAPPDSPSARTSSSPARNHSHAGSASPNSSSDSPSSPSAPPSRNSSPPPAPP